MSVCVSCSTVRHGFHTYIDNVMEVLFHTTMLLCKIKTALSATKARGLLQSQDLKVCSI